MPRPSILQSMVILGMLVSTVAGQNQDKPKLDTLRKGAFTGRDREATRAWLEQEINNLFNAPDAGTTIRSGSLLYFSADGLVTHYQASDATRTFQQGLAELVATAFKTAFQAAPSDPNARNYLAATLTLAALKAFNEPRASLDCFTIALSDPSPGVRLAALDGIIAIWEPLTATQKQAIVGQLQTLATKETDGTTLSRMYAILLLQDQARIKQTAETILRILDTRLAGYETIGLGPLLADTEAMGWLSSNIGALSADPLHKTIVVTAARLLADATESYINEVHSPQREQELEIVIHQADEDLKRIVAAAENAPRGTPDIARTITRTPTDDRKNKVRDELAGWIGNASRKGYLNMAPFNLSPGLEQERVARATTDTGG
ncbi:MAG: hypothetical protein GXY44_05270 [Phycisphaerales bacterium]|nr:hypothetical protein [Phycisphaerales bacterium]